MDYRKWLESYEAFIAALESKQGMEVSNAVFPPQPDKELLRLEEVASERGKVQDFKIPGGLREFYADATGGIDMTWVYRKAPKSFGFVAGRLRLASILALFDPMEEEPQLVEQDLGAGFTLHGQYRTFDDLGPDFHVLAKFTKSLDMPKLYWRTVETGDERIVPLAIGFEDYLAYGLAACFITSWQTLFAEDESLLPKKEEKDFFAKLDLLAPLGDQALLQKARRSLKRAKK